MSKNYRFEGNLVTKREVLRSPTILSENSIINLFNNSVFYFFNCLLSFEENYFNYYFS